MQEAAEWPWSSTGAHLAGSDDGLVTVAPLLEMAGDWQLKGVEEDILINKIRKHERTGRPLGRESFVDQLETALERPLKPGKPGPKGHGN